MITQPGINLWASDTSVHVPFIREGCLIGSVVAGESSWAEIGLSHDLEAREGQSVLNIFWCLHPFHSSGHTDNVGIIESQDIINELFISLPPLDNLIPIPSTVEPAGVNVDTKWSPVTLIVITKVSLEEVVSTSLGFWDGSASISHGATFQVITDKIDHGNGPESFVFADGTWLDLTILGGCVVIGVGPETRSTELEGGHGAFVLEAGCFQDFVHGISSSLEEGSSETFDIGCWDPSKVSHLLALVDNL